MESQQQIGFYEKRKDWPYTVRQYQERFKNLIKNLGESCQEVSREMIEESDTVDPYHFIRNARVGFIFPRQLDVTVFDNSRPDSIPVYSLDRIDRGVDFDTSQVRGYIEVRYDDAGARPMLQIVDKMPNQDSRLPDDALAAIEEAFRD